MRDSVVLLASPNLPAISFGVLNGVTFLGSMPSVGHPDGDVLADGLPMVGMGNDAGLVVLGVLWIRRRPLWVVPVPFAAALVWLGGMSAGGAWLGWTP